jgi:hypothetical protein
MRGEISIHMESPRLKRPSRPPTQDDPREPTDCVILERTHSAEIADHPPNVQTQMSHPEEERQDNEESKSEEEENPPLVVLESPPNAARMLMALLFVLLWFCSGLKLLSKL